MKSYTFTTIIVAIAILFLCSCGEPPIEWQEAQTNQSETKSVTLADGSVVHLNENSYLKHPVEFTQSNRQIEMAGEAFFEVKSGEKQFLITTGTERISTSTPSRFNVNTNETANSTSVNIAEGGATLRPNGGGGKVELIKGIKGIYDREKEALQRIRKATPSDMYWHTKRLEFDETYLARVIDDLIQVFDAEITITNPDLARCLFTYSADNAKLKDVMEAMKKDFGVDVFEETETIYSLTGGSCK